MAAMTLNEFCRKAGDIAAGAPAAEVPPRIADCLPGLLANDTLLAPAQRKAPASGYGRNIVFVFPSGLFSVLAVVWPAGISTPVHDHKTWCAFGVYDGEVFETRYDPADDEPCRDRAFAVARGAHGAGAIAHLPVTGNIHRVQNLTRRTAITIHIYGGDSRRLGPNVERVYKTPESG
jgi:predicted metal-dependent enzyme (double-stranded beta helix superfamily)